MRAFILKAVLYTLPLVIFLLIPFAVLKFSGELNDFSQTAVAADNILGLAYSDQARDYKLHQIFERKPTVLAVGTSRIMQVREFFFRKDVSFYNGGGVIANIGDLSCLATELSAKQYKPRLIILSIDQNFFNEKWDDLSAACQYGQNRKMLPLFTNSLKKVYLDMYRGKVSVKKVFSSADRVGLNAIMKGNGFRHDGSYCYGAIFRKVLKGDTISFAEVENRIKKGINKFEWCARVNPAAVDVLREFAAYCRKNNIDLVMFFPPYPEQIYQRMMQSGKYTYLSKLDSAMEHNQLRVYNFSSLGQLGAADSEAIDGFHASEVAYLRLMRELYRQEENALGRYVDRDQFGLLSAPASPLELIKKD